jgi:hypothetical protein
MIIMNRQLPTENHIISDSILAPSIDNILSNWLKT